ncbi:MAG TPA: alpha/beta hydrolase [Mycobacteriales bacterium]|nr:alpha/beta hydrolase [Mycobacteriales bacterium]
MFVTINDHFTRLVDVGEGPRVLVTHGGWTGNWELWEQQAAALSRQGWRVIAYDHRGAGQSQATPAQITLDALVDDLFAVLDHCGVDRCVLAGESMGALVVLRAAERAPERFAGLLIAGGTARFPKSLQLRAFRLGLHTAYRLTLRNFLMLAVPERDVRRHIRRWGLSILRQATRPNARRLVGVMYGVDQRDIAARVSVPTVVVHGKKDRIVPFRLGEELATLLPDCRFVPLDDAGHVPTLTRPDRIISELQRLADSVQLDAAPLQRW